MDWANGRLINQMAKQLPNLSVASFVGKSKGIHQDFHINIKEIYPLPVPFSLSGGIINSWRIYSTLNRIQKNNDLLIVQLPYIGFIPLRFINKPTIYHLCANVLTASKNPFKYKGLKLLFSTTFARLMHLYFTYLFSKRNAKVIVNGVELGSLYVQYEPKVVVSSSVFESEILPRSEVIHRNQQDPFRLLFIGRPSKEKGFPTLFRAFEKLIDDEKDIVLSLVGVSKEDFTSLVGVGVKERYLSRISFHGYVPWSEEFRQIVQAAHCLLMCSVSEGTPRVIVEAMALGCPVIATRVGGVKGTITHLESGLLFDPEDVEGLTESILSIFYNELLRQRLALNALERVRDFTIERFVSMFIQTINELNINES